MTNRRTTIVIEYDNIRHSDIPSLKGSLKNRGFDTINNSCVVKSENYKGMYKVTAWK